MYAFSVLYVVPSFISQPQRAEGSCVCVRVRVRVRVHVCVYVCVRARVREHVCLRAFSATFSFDCVCPSLLPPPLTAGQKQRGEGVE